MKSRVVAPVLVLAAALSMMNAARYGWGAATIDGDRANGVSPGWAGSLAWRFAVLLAFAAIALSFRRPALAGESSPIEL
jgi:hypothetical protein